MTEHTNAAYLRHLYEAFSAGDLDTIQSAVSDDFVLHSLGRNPVAGDYKGREGLLEFLGKSIEMTGGKFRVELERVLADDEFAVTFEHVEGSRGGRSLDVEDYSVWRFRDGQIVEMTLLTTNPYAHDEFWS